MAIYVRNKEGDLTPLNIPAIKGKDGITPKIKVGEVNTLPAGEKATVEMGGGVENPILNFGIPKGRDGDGVGYGRKLIARYVHNANKIIQPTALDLETGVFTCENHGLVTGDILMVSAKLLSSVPYEIFSANIHPLHPIKANVIDINTFSLNLQGNVLTFGNATNTIVNVNNFHFEKTKLLDKITFNNINLNDFEVYVSGELFCGNYKPLLQIYKNGKNIKDRYDPNKELVVNMNYPTNSIMTPCSYICKVKHKTIEHYINFYQYKTSVSDYEYLKSHPGHYENRCTRHMNKDIRFMEDAYNGNIDMCAFQAHGGYYMTNSTTIEIYDLGGE